MASTMALNLQNKQLQQLARRVKDDPAAFAKLYDYYVQPVYRYLYRRIGSQHDAEDLTSQTFISAYEALPAYQDRGQFAAWLFQIARYKLADYYRREGQTNIVEVTEQNIISEDDTLKQMIQDNDLCSLKTLISALDDNEKDLIYLRYVAGLSYSEMGELLNKKTDAVKKSIYRLLARLKSKME